MRKLRLIPGAGVPELLKDPETRVYRYAANMTVFYLMLGIGFMLTLVALMVYAFGTMTVTRWLVFAFVFALIGVIGVRVLYWRNVLQNHFVATRDDFLYIGSHQNAWEIHESLLTRESMGFESMDLSKTRGVMNIRVGGQFITLRLFSAFVYLAELEAFMGEVLLRIAEEEHLDALEASQDVSQDAVESDEDEDVEA